MATARPPAQEVDADGVPVRLTSPDKPYYPALGERGTKRAVVDYHLAVAPALLEAVRDRPVHLQRFPDGVEGEEVYSKRLPRGAPAHVAAVRVAFPSGRTADVLRPRHAADLVWAVQQSTTTFHPWPCTAPDVEHPDELRVDLDPQPGTGFEQAREVALEHLRPLLAELGLTGLVKTSGGRGLHVVVPLEPRWDFTAVRRAGIALARELERRAGGLVTTAWWKEERGRAVFVDYNQNARDRTIAAAWSLRPTARATVSTPVTWQELADGCAPDDFTLLTVPARLAAGGDPWAGARSPAPLDALLEMADRDEAAGLGDLPYPPNFPKVAGEPPRVQPSRARHDPAG